MHLMDLEFSMSAPREFSITTGTTVFNLPTRENRGFFWLHRFAHQQGMKSYNNILNFVQGANRHNRHHLSLIHCYISKKQTGKELLLFVYKH